MKWLMRTAALIVLGLCGVVSAGAGAWLTDHEAAKAQAAASKRLILINFTGSDWCPACIRLRREVLDQPEFTSYASTNLVLLEVDFPRTRRQTGGQQQANQKLAQQFGVSQFPSLFLADSQGQPRKRISGAGTAAQFVDLLRASPEQRTLRPPVLDRSAGLARDLPLFAGAATKPPIIYTNLVLKSITGGSTRRFALINSETLAAGESVTIKLGNDKVSVHCLEVGTRSVLVKVTGDNTPRELRLADR
jgi:thioredoxin-related protein